MFMLAQIIGLFSFIVSLIAYHKKTKKKILSTMIISNTLNFIHYFLLDALSGGITKIVAVIRDILIINKKNSKSIFYIFVFIYLILGITLYENLLSIISIIASFIRDLRDKTMKSSSFFKAPERLKSWSSLWTGRSKSVMRSEVTACIFIAYMTGRQIL